MVMRQFSGAPTKPSTVARLARPRFIWSRLQFKVPIKMHTVRSGCKRLTMPQEIEWQLFRAILTMLRFVNAEDTTNRFTGLTNYEIWKVRPAWQHDRPEWS